jgi:hypothetical protein
LTIFDAIFGKNPQINCTRIAISTGQFFGQNYEIWTSKSLKISPKIRNLGEIYAQTLNLKVRIPDFSKIAENI